MWPSIHETLLFSCSCPLEGHGVTSAARHWLTRRRLRQHHHGAHHAGMDRAGVFVGARVREDNAIAAREGQTVANWRVQVLLVEKNARGEWAVRDAGARWNRRLASLGEEVCLRSRAR